MFSALKYNGIASFNFTSKFDTFFLSHNLFEKGSKKYAQEISYYVFPNTFASQR